VRSAVFAVGEGTWTMRKFVVSLCLLLAGLSIFVLGNPYYRVFPTNGNLVYCAALTVFFFVLALALKRSHSLARYSPAAYGLFTASAALLFLSTGLLNTRACTTDPLLSLARDKVNDFVHIVPVIIVLTLVAKDDLTSIFIARGNLKAGLLFGSASFAAWAVLAFLIQAGASGMPRLSASAILFILIYVFGNAIMEELWFRAVFLKRYQPLIGRWAAILVTSAVFGTSHVNATYEFPGGGIVFGVVVFVLGVVGAYSIYKTDSLIGAVLFHAGYDLTIIVPVLNSQ
jgi:membrane protease YdiL (CAAX protease family)